MMLGIFITLVVIGFIFWLVDTYIPMDAGIKQLVRVVAVVFIVLWLLSVLFGYSPHLARPF